MSVLVKAFLEAINHDGKAGDPVDVQFNPTTLALSLTNSTDSSRSKGQQARQYLGDSAAELTLELVFDTADEGTVDHPVSVREKTVILERHLLPTPDKKAPPRLRFTWGDLIIEGKVDSLTLDFDLFAATGVPLRAKAKLSLREQDPKWAREPTTKPTTTAPGATTAASVGASANAPTDHVSKDGKLADRVVAALAGETPPELAARVGLDPQAWRGLDASLSQSLSLEAGASVGFRADLSLSAGVGMRAGASAGVDASLTASLGLQGPAGGFALAAAGGLEAALATAADALHTTAVAATRAAFSAPAAITRPPSIDRTPLRLRGSRTDTLASPPPTPDPRATSFGRGVPLRDRFRDDLPARPELRLDPTRPPWEQRSPVVSTSVRASTCRCTCACRCQESR